MEVLHRLKFNKNFKVYLKKVILEKNHPMEIISKFTIKILQILNVKLKI